LELFILGFINSAIRIPDWIGPTLLWITSVNSVDLPPNIREKFDFGQFKQNAINLVNRTFVYGGIIIAQKREKKLI
jgi:hypothetical protein